MLKKELRLNFTSQRRQLSQEEVIASGISIGNLLQSLPIWNLQNYHVFLPIKRNNEIDTSPIIHLLRTKKKEVYIPKVKNESDLDSILLRENTELIENKWGIPEPSKGDAVDPQIIDVVFIPLLVFDKRGHRVGYGKGYYDRFLRSCRGDVIKIGLGYFEAIEEIQDINPEDIAMDYCVTPNKIYSF